MEVASEHARQAEGRPAAERYMCMLLHAPGSTGMAGEPVGGMESLRNQMYVLSRDIPELGPELGSRSFGDLGPALDAARGRCAESGLVSGRGGGDDIRLTPRGRREAEALWNASDRVTRMTVAVTKRLLNGMSRWELVSFMLSEFPEVKVTSEIAGEFERRRLGAAASLAKRHKVSIIKAASIAGMETEDFEAELRRRGIHPYSLDREAYEESLRTIERISGH